MNEKAIGALPTGAKVWIDRAIYGRPVKATFRSYNYATGEARLRAYIPRRAGGPATNTKQTISVPYYRVRVR